MFLLKNFLYTILWTLKFFYKYCKFLISVSCSYIFNIELFSHFTICIRILCLYLMAFVCFLVWQEQPTFSFAIIEYFNYSNYLKCHASYIQIPMCAWVLLCTHYCILLTYLSICASGIQYFNYGIFIVFFFNLVAFVFVLIHNLVRYISTFIFLWECQNQLVRFQKCH